jgi:hypothetical protein
MLLLRGQCVQLPLQLPIHTSGQVQRCHHKHFSVRSADACEYNDSIYITTKMVTDSNALRDAGVSQAQQPGIAVHAALAGARGMYSLRIAGLSDNPDGGYDLENLLCLHLGLHSASLQADA